MQDDFSMILIYCIKLILKIQLLNTYISKKQLQSSTEKTYI